MGERGQKEGPVKENTASLFSPGNQIFLVIEGGCFSLPTEFNYEVFFRTDF